MKRIRTQTQRVVGSRRPALGVAEALAVVWISLLTVALVFVSFYLFALAQGVSKLEQQTTWNTKLIWACHDYAIRPCDDASVTKWNEQNPDRTISDDWLRTPY